MYLGFSLGNFSNFAIKLLNFFLKQSYKSQEIFLVIWNVPFEYNSVFVLQLPNLLKSLWKMLNKCSFQSLYLFPTLSYFLGVMFSIIFAYSLFFLWWAFFPGHLWFVWKNEAKEGLFVSPSTVHGLISGLREGWKYRLCALCCGESQFARVRFPCPW